MFKKIVILIAFYFVPYQSILAQNKAIIQPFFEKELKENLRFEIILPYKVEIIPQTIKRSNVPEFSIYELVPRKRKKCRLNLSISQTQD
ncbi:MAG: hypothetical protein KDD49_14195, partial [Bacteroidetes bacterium]|nr:hypothetical protein [Bacteroidota bacterium]